MQLFKCLKQFYKDLVDTRHVIRQEEEWEEWYPEKWQAERDLERAVMEGRAPPPVLLRNRKLEWFPEYESSGQAECRLFGDAHRRRAVQGWFYDVNYVTREGGSWHEQMCMDRSDGPRPYARQMDYS